jgi:D-alanine-D-alanine ligase
LARGPEWRDERDVVSALDKLGHDIRFYPVFDEIDSLITKIKTESPDVVFCSCESVMQKRELSHRLVGILELLKIPFTGAGVNTLQICADKALSKKILKYHSISAPNFLVWDGQIPLSEIELNQLKFPVIIKPLKGEGSEGIHQNSIARNYEYCTDRMQRLIEKFPDGIIVEEFIEGREVYVGIFGREQPRMLRPREFIIAKPAKSPESRSLVASFRAKWDDEYRKKHGIHTRNIRSLDRDLQKKIDRIVSQTHKALNIDGYARLDLRISSDNEIHVLEANPNPAISRQDDFAAAAASDGIGYEELIQKILELGINRTA